MLMAFRVNGRVSLPLKAWSGMRSSMEKLKKCKTKAIYTLPASSLPLNAQETGLIQQIYTSRYLLCQEEQIHQIRYGIICSTLSAEQKPGAPNVSDCILHSTYWH